MAENKGLLEDMAVYVLKQSQVIPRTGGVHKVFIKRVLKECGTQERYP
jgi:hypothetical protein